MMFGGWERRKGVRGPVHAFDADRGAVVVRREGGFRRGEGQRREEEELQEQRARSRW
jgi:hypothetical protein